MNTNSPKDYPLKPHSRFETGEKNAKDEPLFRHGEVSVGRWNFFDFDDEAKKPIWVEKPKNNQTTTIFTYIPSEQIKALIRLAQILKRPILIKGEPGSGKTQLAKAVAYEWYGKDYEQYFFDWYIKSHSKASDGIYSFDHIARLRDAQLQEKKEPKAYRQFGPLSKAFLSCTPDEPTVLLIDEIDKADIDFPNDLLLELDEKRFSIPETKEDYAASKGASPLIIITSNDERELPEAFLRRCLFLYVKFPGDDDLKKIIRAHIPNLMEKHEEFVTLAIARFNKLKTDQEVDPNDSKRVSTSELLDWLKAYDYELAAGDMMKFKESLDTLPHYYNALLKTLGALKREKKQ